MARRDGASIEDQAERIVRQLALLDRVLQDQLGRRQQHCELGAGQAAAVRRAARIAQPGDVVLLSPACASFDQFRDFEARGDAFAAAVAALE